VTAKLFFTTREAAKLLSISQSTVSRKFDRGFFTGKKNPITGKRLISRESISAIMNQYLQRGPDPLLVDLRVLLATPDKGVLSLFENILSGRKGVQVTRVEFGGDVLLQVGKEPPDLLVLDEELSDIPCGEILRSLTREGQTDLRILCLTKGGSTWEAAEGGTLETLPKDKIDQPRLTEKLGSLLGISEDLPTESEVFEHQRRWPRKNVDLPANIWVYRMRSPHRRDAGRARIKDISLRGACLSDLELEKGELPCEAFRILLEVHQAPLNDFRVHCRVVRFQSNGMLSAGVEFARISKSHQEMIEAMFQS